MLLLADENFPGPVITTLRSLGHDVLWARTDCASESDALLLERAEAEGRILLTLDKDFWQIALQRSKALKHSGVVLFRVHPAIPANLEPFVLRFLRMPQSWVGAVAVVTPDAVQQFASGRR